MIHWAYVDHTPFVISERSLLKEQMSCYGYSLILPGGLSESEVIQEMEEHNIALKNCYLDRSPRVETKHDAFQEMLDRLSPEDTVFLPSLNCIAASIGEVVESIRVIEEKQALVVIGDMPLYSAALNNISKQNGFEAVPCARIRSGNRTEATEKQTAPGYRGCGCTRSAFRQAVSLSSERLRSLRNCL